MAHGRRLALGIFVLLLVDIIWVASSELSEYIFHDSGFDKPFFSTYLKTSMFSLYLLGFIFWSPWRHQCSHNLYSDDIYQVAADNEEDEESSMIDDRRLVAADNEEDEESSMIDDRRLRRESALDKVEPIFTVDQLASCIAVENKNSAQLTHMIRWHYLPTSVAKEPVEKSEPSYEPLKLNEQEKSSDGDSDDSSMKSVRFSKLTEVRQMAESEAVDAMMSRLSFSASLRAEQLALQAANKLTIKEVMKISSIFCLLWFLGNYGYQIALSDTQAGVVNVISSTSGLFTLMLAAIFPSSISDKFTLSKLATVFLMVAGVVLVSLEDISLEGGSVPVGVVWSLVGAILYACYMVFLKRKVPTEDRMDFSMFFGFVGLFNTILLWPGFPLLDVLGWESFQLPNKSQWLYMSINGLVGTVFSELLWLWGCFLTSSLMATLSLSLTIPLTMIVDTWVKNIEYSYIFYIGSIPMMLSFVIVTLLTHYDDWDPLMDGIKFIHRKCFRQSVSYSLVDTDGIERESLIVSKHDEDEEGGDEDEVDTTYITNPLVINDGSSPDSIIINHV